jgi:hypothetical protein
MRLQFEVVGLLLGHRLVLLQGFGGQRMSMSVIEIGIGIGIGTDVPDGG